MKRCKYGPLKSPSRGRRCKKRGSARGRGTRCVNGKLKHPKGRRVCRKPTMMQKVNRRLRRAHRDARRAPAPASTSRSPHWVSPYGRYSRRRRSR